MTPVALGKYLRTRAVSGPWRIEGTMRVDFVAAVVIPALDELQSLPATLDSLAGNPDESLADILILVVVNHGPDASAPQRESNLQTLRMLEGGAARWRRLNLGWIDAASPGRELPAGEGVGLARRIGCDLALERLDWRGDPFLVWLDADTLVRPDYLVALSEHFRGARQGGAVLSFCHRRGGSEAEDAAITLYELYLRHYVLGLQLAGSPYAYHTVGSALACRAAAYVAAGGVNRRRAAEDFYFLQQLAKTSGVARVRGTVVYPAARLSRRTPFGTGPAMERLIRGEQTVHFHCTASFRILQRWLQAVDHNPGAEAQDVLSVAGEISASLADFLETCNFCAVWGRLRGNHQTLESFLEAFHRWFDALKSRRLLRALDEAYGLMADPEGDVFSLLAWANLESDRNLGSFLAVLRDYQIGESY